MIIKKYIALISILTILISGCAQAESQKYTRSQCIVKVELLWDALITNKEREEHIRNIVKSINFSPKNGYRKSLPSLTIQGRGQFLYLQYEEQCNQKSRITNELLTLYVAPKVSGFPAYKIIEEVISPGPETINVKGPAWLDGKKDNRPR